jgi:hypothetical protein
MSYALQVFVSSTCYELRDLRAAIREWLTHLGLTPMMSDEGGFPHVDGMPPYATCLRVLEECPLVIGVIDRRYGKSFDDWGPYPQFRGCSPTHAELRHALDLGKRALVYIHDDLWNFYEVWRKNPDAFKSAAPHGLEVATLKMLHELKLRSPSPWLGRFADVVELQRSLNREFVNQLYGQLRDSEKQTVDSASYLLEKIVEAAPEVRERIAAGLNPSLVMDRESLQQRLDMIEGELDKTKGATQEKISGLEREKNDIQTRLNAVTQQLGRASLLLARAAMKDASWFDFVRRTMMPRQPGRVPFHNSAEVALRGFHAAAGGRQKPMLREVTWSKLQYVEGGLHRGYKAGIIFKGGMFTPGVTWTQRRRGETGPPTGNNDYFWRLPNIYFGDYLEVSCADDAVEGPLSWRDCEFQVKNPEGRTSDWVLFTYPFDDELLMRIRSGSLQKGNELLAAGKAAEAVEPLRRAYVFSDRMLGVEHEETLRAKSIWERARDEAALAKLRFRVSEELTVTAGPHAGKRGVVVKLLLNHLHAYLIKPAVGDEFQASDAQVDRAIAD